MESAYPYAPFPNIVIPVISGERQSESAIADTPNTSEDYSVGAVASGHTALPPFTQPETPTNADIDAEPTNTSFALVEPSPAPTTPAAVVNVNVADIIQPTVIANTLAMPPVSAYTTSTTNPARLDLLSFSAILSSEYSPILTISTSASTLESVRALTATSSSPAANPTAASVKAPKSLPKIGPMPLFWFIALLFFGAFILSIPIYLLYSYRKHRAAKPQLDKDTDTELAGLALECKSAGILDTPPEGYKRADSQALRRSLNFNSHPGLCSIDTDPSLGSRVITRGKSEEAPVSQLSPDHIPRPLFSNSPPGAISTSFNTPITPGPLSSGIPKKPVPASTVRQSPLQLSVLDRNWATLDRRSLRVSMAHSPVSPLEPGATLSPGRMSINRQSRNWPLRPTSGEPPEENWRQGLLLG